MPSSLADRARRVKLLRRLGRWGRKDYREQLNCIADVGLLAYLLTNAEDWLFSDWDEGQGGFSLALYDAVEKEAPDAK